MKERIIGHTTRMFARDGVKAVRMDDIAAEMGISKRTIYEIFGDKETLIYECLDHFQNRMRTLKDEATRGENNIIAEYLAALELWDKQMEAASRIIDDVNKFYPRIHERYVREHACAAAMEIRDKLRQGIEQGYLVPWLDVELAMSIFDHSMYSMIKTGRFGGSSASHRVAFRFFSMHFMRGISTAKGIGLIDKKLSEI